MQQDMLNSKYDNILNYMWNSLPTINFGIEYQVPELQCHLRVKEDLSKVLILQDAKNNV